MTLWMMLITIPAMALTAWVANRIMLFILLRPINFIGIRPFFGIRGIVPFLAPKIATGLVENITSNIATVAELYSTLGPERIAEHMAHSLRPRVGELIEDIILEDFPTLWDGLDESLLREITADINEGLEPVLHEFMQEIGSNIDHYLDVQRLTQARLVDQPELLVKLFENVGDQEFRFIRHGGAWMGALAGIPLAAVATWHHDWISLSLTGAASLAAINAVILFMIFFPRQPIRIGSWMLQGRFPRRQEEAAVVACRIFSRDVIGLQQIMTLIFQGERSDELRGILRRAVSPVIDAATANFGTIVVPRIGTKGFEQLKERIAQDTVDVTRVPFDDPIFNHERQVAVERTFLDRLLELAPVEFEQLLRPAFKQVEWLLVAGGGLAGGIMALILSTYWLIR